MQRVERSSPFNLLIQQAYREGQFEEGRGVPSGNYANLSELNRLRSLKMANLKDIDQSIAKRINELRSLANDSLNPLSLSLLKFSPDKDSYDIPFKDAVNQAVNSMASVKDDLVEIHSAFLNAKNACNLDDSVFAQLNQELISKQSLIHNTLKQIDTSFSFLQNLKLQFQNSRTATYGIYQMLSEKISLPNISKGKSSLTRMEKKSQLDVGLKNQMQLINTKLQYIDRAQKELSFVRTRLLDARGRISSLEPIHNISNTNLINAFCSNVPILNEAIWFANTISNLAVPQKLPFELLKVSKRALDTGLNLSLDT
jgi:hypothetical protein